MPLHALRLFRRKRGPLIARFMGPTWGPPWSCRSQVGPILAPWTLLSGGIFNSVVSSVHSSVRTAYCRRYTSGTIGRFTPYQVNGICLGHFMVIFSFDPSRASHGLMRLTRAGTQGPLYWSTPNQQLCWRNEFLNIYRTICISLLC